MVCFLPVNSVDCRKKSLILASKAMRLISEILLPRHYQSPKNYLSSLNKDKISQSIAGRSGLPGGGGLL